MKRCLLIALILAAALSGCTSKAVKHEVLEVKAEKPELTATVIGGKPDDSTLDHRAYHNYVNGLIYDRVGDYSEAAASFNKALKYHYDSYQVRISLAETYFRMRKFRDAIKVLEEIEPEDADVHLIRGAAFASMGETDSARVAYTRLISVDSSNSTAYSHLAGHYREVGDIDSLIWAYNHLARIRPDNERVWRELGRLQVQKGEYELARSSFRSSIQARSDATNILSYLSLAELYAFNEQPDSAIAIYKAALQIEPYNVSVNKELANIYVRLDSLGEALDYARNVVRATPLDRDAVRRLGVIYYGLDSLRQADSIFTYLVDSGERHSLNHFYLGRIAALQQDYPRAIDQFTKLTQMADSIAESWMDLGYAYRKMRQPEKEILTYQTGLGHVKDEQGQLGLMFALGAAYEQSGQIPEAVALFEEIIAKSPDHDKALNYLGYMLADRGERLEYARDLIERAVKLSPENGAYLDSYGWVYFRLNDFDKAVEYLEKAVMLDSNPVIFDHLGDAYEATGQFEKARIWWDKALELQPDDVQIKHKLDR